MPIRVLDPRGEVQTRGVVRAPRIARLDGRAVGYVFNHHPSAVGFWADLEAELARRWVPDAVHRIDKTNVSITVPPEDLRRLVEKTAYAVVGVGA